MRKSQKSKKSWYEKLPKASSVSTFKIFVVITCFILLSVLFIRAKSHIESVATVMGIQSTPSEMNTTQKGAPRIEKEDVDEGEKEDEDDKESSHSASPSSMRKKSHEKQEDEDEKEDDGDVRISTGSARRSTISRKGVHAFTTLPVSLDDKTKRLIVVTEKGERPITILPDQAVERLIEHGVISALDTSQEGAPVTLSEENGEPVFFIKGKKEKKLFGLFHRSYQKTAVISTEDGSTRQVKQSMGQSILEMLSF